MRCLPSHLSQHNLALFAGACPAGPGAVAVAGVEVVAVVLVPFLFVCIVLEEVDVVFVFETGVS